LVSSKVNLPTKQVWYEGVDYQHSIGPHDWDSLCSCEDWCSRQSSPSTSASDDDAMYPNFLYHNICFVCHLVCCFPMKQKLLFQKVCHTICLFRPQSRCTIFQVFGHQQIVHISGTLQQLHFNKQCLLHDISIEFDSDEILHHSSSIKSL